MFCSAFSLSIDWLGTRSTLDHNECKMVVLVCIRVPLSILAKTTSGVDITRLSLAESERYCTRPRPPPVPSHDTYDDLARFTGS
jgi:hypothetical protein